MHHVGFQSRIPVNDPWSEAHLLRRLASGSFETAVRAFDDSDVNDATGRVDIVLHIDVALGLAREHRPREYRCDGRNQNRCVVRSISNRVGCTLYRANIYPY